MSTTPIIAERYLVYSDKGSDLRREFVVRVRAPQLITKADFNFDPGAATCDVEFDGISIKPITMHGVDTLHAVAQAVDLDKLLGEMSRKFDFFWPSGEPYFE